MIQAHVTAPSSIGTRRAKRPVSLLLGLFSSVWFGVILAVLLFVYCSIGSAVPAVRQLPALEMTEFQWFHWWPFNLLIVLFSVTMITVTIRRIPFRFVNAGVLMIHSGIIVLTLGSYYYFGTKVEGDTPVFRRRVVINHPSLTKPVSLLAIPGDSRVVNIGPDTWRFSIQSTNSAWPILSEKDKGHKAYAVNVLVTPAVGEPFIRQLLAGYPQYTEDVLPGKGRAIKNIGRKLVDKDLSLSLDVVPQDYFHVMDTWALYVRKVGSEQWAQRPIHDMPRYNDRVGSRDQVFTDPHTPITPETLDITVPPAPGGDALSLADVHVTGYLRYARLQSKWIEGDRFNPVLALSAVSSRGTVGTYELVALDARRRSAAEGSLEFLWVNDAAELDKVPVAAQATLHVSVPEQGVTLDVPLTAEVVTGRDGAFRPIEGTEFAYRVVNVHDNLSIPGKNQSISIAMVDVKTPEGQFTRMVADRPEMSRDMAGDSSDPHAQRKPEEADKRIVMTYQPASAPILFVGYPGGLRFFLNGPTGRTAERTMTVGDEVEVMTGIKLRVDGLWVNAKAQVKPFIVPPARRDSKAGEMFAMIRLEINTGDGVVARWVRYNHYALPGPEYAYRGRFAYSPEVFRLADGTHVEVVFSRERRPLPNPVALDAFTLDTHIGGYSGAVSAIRNYESRLRFLDNGQWSKPTTIAVNQPTEFGGMWFFQSMWDKPPNDNPTGGMNYTGLGVGNRNGVYVQLAGCVLAVIGMIFAFYVKPVIKRRRAIMARARAGLASGARDDDDIAVQPVAVEQEVTART